MEKIVKAGLRDCTVNLDGTECAVRFDSCFRAFAVRNDSAGDVFISKTAGIVPDADGVMCVKSGASAVYAHMDIYADTVYLLGKGKVQLHAQNDTVNPFNYAPVSDDGGEKSGESSYTIENAVDYPIMGINVYGKSTQSGTPTPENPVEIVSVGDSGSVAVQSCGKNLFDYSLLPDTAYNGVTFKNNNDGTFTIIGEKNDISKSFISSVNLSHEESIGIFPSGNYTISGFPKNWGLHASIGLFYNGKMYNSVANTVNNPTLTITKDILTDDFNVSISVYSASNNQITVGTFYLQIEKGSIATDFEPYNGATANITTSMPLCGIPVESGGNYTDSNGQQWVCDELIYRADGTGKIVKRTAKIDSYNGETISTPYISTTGSLSTGATVIYQIAEPQEIELTAAEMTALRELQTFSGTTSISNSSGAEMSVKYCTNKALSEFVRPVTMGLQKQIDELKSAVLSLGGNI